MLKIDPRLFTVCAVFVEERLIRATKEDIISSVYERLKESMGILDREGMTTFYTSRENIEEVIDEVLSLGCKQNVIEEREDFYTLTELGKQMGTHWVHIVNKIKER